MPTISVIIPTYNCAKYLSDSIESVLNQTYHDFEIVIIDDGSVDETCEVVQKYISNHPNKIRYFYQENKGTSEAKNKGIKEALGEYIFHLDADDEMAPGALEKCVNAVKNSEAEWCITDVLLIKNDKKETKITKMPQNNYFINILKDDFIWRAPFFKKSVLYEIGLYDKMLYIREDWDLKIRLIREKKRFVYLNSPIYIYKLREKSLVKGNTKNNLFATLKLIKKHHKKLADAGNNEISKIYSELMWDLARRYLYQLKDIRMTIYCLKESIKYDFKIERFLHAVLYRLKNKIF
jgi:glycosyltransferase involved in cell wall biosynthesis